MAKRHRRHRKQAASKAPVKNGLCLSCGNIQAGTVCAKCGKVVKSLDSMTAEESLVAAAHIGKIGAEFATKIREIIKNGREELAKHPELRPFAPQLHALMDELETRTMAMVPKVPPAKNK